MASKQSRMDRLYRSGQFTYPKRNARPPSPRENASFIQVLLVSWLLPLLQLGMKRELTELDLYPTLFEDYADHIGDTLEIKWGDHIEQRKKKKKKPSIAKLLMSTYGTKFLFFGMFSLAEETIFRMIQVIAIGYVLDYFEGNYLTTLTGTVIFGVGGILLGAASFIITFHWSVFNMHHVCTHIRLGLSSLVYRKILHLNHASMRSSTVGQIVTMIASDLHRFDRKHIHINYLWIAPVHLIVVIYILYFHFNYGGSSLIGLSVLLFFTFTQYFMAKKFHQMRQKRVESSDLRIRAVVEIINAFYTIKVHCWERFFYDKAMDNRRQEVKILRTTLFLKLLNTALGFIVTKMAVFMTLLFAFIFEDPGSIHSKRVFVTLVMYEHVRVNFMILFPHAINDMAELSSACTRINSFLTLEELQLPVDSEEALSKVIEGPDQSPCIVLHNLKCRWFKDENFHLEHINLNAHPGQLIVVCGPVASGKSTLVAAVLGELPPEEGHVLVLGRIAYVPQVPALFPGSIRRNIIFGYGTNLKWYHEVIRMCGLESEFEKFPNGDQSLVENTQMTTAQKAKICIARALYANADVYVLDDPLQSMDVKHHRQILETVIRGALRDKVVLLVTHQIHFLEEATEIVLINNGKIHKTGTYKELVQAGIEFISEMEDNFTLDDDDDGADNESIIIQQGILSDVVMSPKDLRHRGSIQFEIDERANLKRVSMAPASDKIRISRGEVPVTEMALLVHDDEASDSKDKILAPKKISFTLYYEFLHKGSSRMMLIFVLGFCIISQVLYTLTDIFIEHWAHAEEVKRAHPTTPVSNTDSTHYSIIIYSVLLASIVSFSFGRSMLIFRICTRASTCIFTKLLNATIESRMHFFEKTCAGHAINRLSKDMSIIDDLLPPTFMELVGVIFEILGALSILAFANFWFTIPALAFIFANLVVYRMYHLTAADLKRIEGNARSPIYSHLSRTLQGVSTIRAFGQEQAFIMIFDRLQDNHTASWNLFISAQSWLGVIVDCVSVVLIGMICLSFFYLETNPAAVGLTISKMIELSILVQFAVGEMSNTETQMISVERVLEYAHPQEQGQFEIFDGPEPPIEWPSEGKIEMTSLRLTPKDAGINLTIEAGQKIGIVGRAGSGKTRLLNSLFRVSEPCGGSIKIDGIDIKTIGLQNLRGHISIIPQTPCMFAGTVRQNMDPFNKHSDDEIWDALSDCVMSDAITRMGNGLNAVVHEYGSNFSAGQRQFICLARAILAKKKILLCDEPTASLDGLSSIIMIQNIKNRFANSTVLLVAHRISSVMYCDKLVVMEGGDIVDQGSPLELLQKKNGPFFDMVKQLGQKTMDELIQLAKDQQEERKEKYKRRKSTTADMLPSTGLGLSNAFGNLQNSKI